MIPVKSVDDVAIEIRHAIYVLKALPKDGPRKVKAFWPVYLSSKNQNKFNDFSTFLPMADEIDDMDLVLEKWLKVLPIDDRRLVYLRCEGKSWRYLQNKFQLSRSAIYNRYVRSLKIILDYVLELQKEQKNDFL